MPGQRRPAHKAAHHPCPFGQSSWSDCDAAAGHQWGKCTAMVGDRDPEPCSRWAFDAQGFCGQHYTTQKEAELRRTREVAHTLQLNIRIDAYIAWTADHPSVWDSKFPPRGTAGAPQEK